MFTDVLSKHSMTIFGCVILITLCVGLPQANAEKCKIYGCQDDCEFTTDFRLEDCIFQTEGENPYFILEPGYQLVLETPGDADAPEKSVETVLEDTYKIDLNGTPIWTRVVEERAFERDGEEWITVEISRNYFAICDRTNAVYYFGEESRDCEEGFDENDECSGVESTEGSWEAGVDNAMPGLMMPGTPLLGAKYFQEIAPENDAVDRGQINALGLYVEVLNQVESGCIEIYDTNPAEKSCRGENDAKLYCPGIGLVKDQDLELVWYGYIE